MPSLAAAATEKALVTAGYGRHYLVRPATPAEASDAATDDRSEQRQRTGELIAVTRGKRTDPCVGDRVRIRAVGDDQAVIESIEARRNEIRRSDRWRSKLLAANIDQVGIVLAGDPPFSEELLLRMLAASDAAGVPAALVANKSDLVEASAAVASRLAVYQALGLKVFAVAVGSDPQATRDSLRDWLAGRTTLLIGQSGMGKSTLVNALVPDAELRTQTISEALASGRHTTTFSRLFDLPAEHAPDARIVDTPGFQTFGIAHLSTSQLVHAMPEFASYLGRCRFNDCTHRDEPDCAIRAAAEAGEIDARRLQLYGRLVDETLRNPSRPRP
ncbi:MAG: ribosome small subunit-dependent GTPase A [Limnobacter sp.]|nr:ribosome small subunit-dependent GTPase A [Limnobacter sp.]